MASVTLHLGCRVSKDKFSVLWQSDAMWRADEGKWLFFLSYNDFEFLLELSHDNARQIELHSRAGRDAKFLLFQLHRAPNISEKCKYSFFPVYDDPWMRTTDFTPSSIIGQSSHACLELPYNFEFENFKGNFKNHEESEIILVKGKPFLKSLALVPIVECGDFNLPYGVQFKISSIVQKCIVPGLTLHDEFFHLLDPRERDIRCIEYALENLLQLNSCCYDPVSWLKGEYERQPRELPDIAFTLDGGLVYVRGLKVTPCKVYFYGPIPTKSNRVLRHFSQDLDNFLRVSFVDEDFNKLSATVVSRRLDLGEMKTMRTGVAQRIKDIIVNGLVIGDKHFEFLAFLSSQLNNNSLWMFARKPGQSAADIRKWMGDFSNIRNVAKYAARLGQCLSASTETWDVRRDEIEIIPDVEDSSSGIKYVFSDGIGKISQEFASKVAEKCGLDTSPSAFQIRYAGYKGVVAVDPTSSVKLSLRSSMRKFESTNTKLDVLEVSKNQPLYLNRQLIVLLSTLGVDDSVFEKKQEQAVGQWYTISADPSKALRALELLSPGEITNILKEMLVCGFKPRDEPFLSMMLQVFEASKLIGLRTKTRIYISNGRCMMGCLDETRTLEYGEVFVQISGLASPGSSSHDSLPQSSSASGSNQDNVILGDVFVAKSPCLHPGDVRLLRAVNVPALKHMVDCVVFPQKGKRPHPDECFGSDLDGDIYFVCWDSDLLPPVQYHPFDYSSAPKIEVNHEVTIEEVIEHFVNFIGISDVGKISNAHVAYADREHYKAKSEPCLELAKIFPSAVDYPKGGVRVTVPRHLPIKEFPDFLARTGEGAYVSEGLIGRLFRACKDVCSSSFDSFMKAASRNFYDADMEVQGFRDYVDCAYDNKISYDTSLRSLMQNYDIKYEAEILGSCTVDASKYNHMQDNLDSIALAVSSLRKEARSWFDNQEGTSNRGADDVHAKASAWYYVTYSKEYWGRGDEGRVHNHFLSFPWCVSDLLIKIKKEKSSSSPGCID